MLSAVTPRWGEWRRRSVLALLLVALAVASLAQWGNRPEGQSTTPESSRLLGTYGRPVVEPGGGNRIDVEATVAHLLDVGANTYAYLIGPALPGGPSPSRQQWKDLPRFAVAAGETRIQVHVYLVPPTEAPDPSRYGPYGWDYVRWARELGKVARDHPAIRGIIIDDLGTNQPGRSRFATTFDDQTLTAMRSEAKRQAPWLTLLGVFYSQDLFGAGAVNPSVVHSLDGVVFPYLGKANVATAANTSVTGFVEDQAKAVGSGLTCVGSTTCTQLTFAKSSPNRVPVATSAPLGSCASAQACRLSMGLSDNRAAGSRTGAVVEVLMDGKVVSRVRPPTGSHSLLDFDLRELAGGSGGAVALRVRPAEGSVLDGLSVRLHGLRRAGAWSNDIPMPGWSGETEVSRERDQQFIFMAYASPLGAEARTQVQPAYVEEVLARLETVWSLADVDGTLIYLLPTGDLGAGSTMKKVVRDGFAHLRADEARRGSESPR